MAVHKSNLAQRPPSLSYRIVTSEVHDTARVEWAGTTDHDANSLASGPANPAEKSKLDEAKEFLRDELSDGPMWAKLILRDARDAGVATATLYGAKTALRVRSEKIGVEGWQWSLPTKEGDDPPADANVPDVHHVHHVQNGRGHHPPNSPYIWEGGEGVEDVEGSEGVGSDVGHHHLPGGLGGDADALLADPPGWLADQLRRLYREPERLFGPTVHSVRREIGDAATEAEVERALVRHLHERGEVTRGVKAAREE
jgi:hypothetical protein